MIHMIEVLCVRTDWRHLDRFYEFFRMIHGNILRPSAQGLLLGHHDFRWCEAQRLDAR
jgi:hypothetical protein